MSTWQTKESEGKPEAQPQLQRARSSIVDLPAVGSADVAVFWDFENVRIPAWCPATSAAEGIRGKVTKYGRIVEKRLYYDSRQPGELSAPRSDLDLSGFTLVDCPSRGRKETLDKKLIVDVLCFAWERASLGAKACVVLITSDGDYSYALARLRDIGVFTIVIYRPDIVAKVLIDNANVVMSWEFDVLGGPPASRGDDNSEDDESAPAPDDVSTGADMSIARPDLLTKGKFATFCSVVLNCQHQNVREGISVYSSWAAEAPSAATYYEKVGEKDRDGYVEMRILATEKGFIEWGRRKLTAVGKPVVKVKDRDDRGEDLSNESYLRLTYAGLSVVNPNIASKESDWKMASPRQSGKSSTENSAPETSILPPANKARSDGRLFVGGLHWSTTEDSLRSYFRQYGPLDRVLVKEDRGFGFVFFRSPNDSEAVLKNAGNHIVDHKHVDVKPYVGN